VSIQEQGPLAIGIDVGGTKIAAAVVDASGNVLGGARTETPTGGSAAEAAVALEEAIVRIVSELQVEQPVVGVGLGIAGLVATPGDVVMTATNLRLEQHPLRDRLQDQLGVPVRIENDATAAAWAEYRFGAGAGADPLLVVTVGTGLGGGIVVGGELVRGAFGTAGEVGHVVLERDGRPCECGDRGCLEQYASGRALVREARLMVRDFAGASLGLVARCDGDPAKLDGHAVTAAAQGGDAGALRVFGTVGAALGRGIASIVNVLDPAVVVIGGGVAEAGDLLLEPTRAAFAQHVIGTGHRPLAPIVPALAGNRAGAIGAADLVRLLA
jgi:glucokinase